MSNKIAFLVNSLNDGGAEKVIKLLVEALSKNNIYVELICLEKNNIYTINKNIKISYLSNFTGRESEIKKMLFMPLLAFRLMKYIKLNHIYLVQSHLFRANYINILSKILFRSNQDIQVVNHSITSRYLKNGLAGKINLFLIKKLYPFSNKIISVSSIVQHDMQELFNFSNESEVIYNPFDIKCIKELSQKYITDFKFETSKKYIISVGRLIKLKRNRDLINALLKLDDSIELIFIGEGKEKENLVKLSKKLNISDRIYFIGWVNNPYKYIKNSDILISTSESESFGNILVESMICKTAVISTDCGGPSEIIDNGENGILVETGNTEQLIQSINTLLLDDNIKNRYIKNAYVKIKKFDIVDIVEKYKKTLGIYS